MRFTSSVSCPVARADVAPAHAESCIPFETNAERILAERNR
jgi:hypothetical protein